MFHLHLSSDSNLSEEGFKNIRLLNQVQSLLSHFEGQCESLEIPRQIHFILEITCGFCELYLCLDFWVPYITEQLLTEADLFQVEITIFS